MRNVNEEGVDDLTAQVLSTQRMNAIRSPFANTNMM